MPVAYNFEFDRRLRAGFIGCGGHAFRNVFPVFQYVPVELAAVADLDGDRAARFARLFGAERSYDHHARMLDAETLDVVFIVTGYDDAGRVLYPALARDALLAGAHVWIEKPPVNDLDDVALLREAVASSGRKLAVGFKKMFAPANVRAAALIRAEPFGPVQSLSLRYPQYIPTPAEMARAEPLEGGWRPRVGFLDHLCHPVSLLQLLGGRTKRLLHTRADGGAGFALFELHSGARATLHFTHGQSRSAPLERTEVIGRDANLVVENNTTLIYHRPVPRETGHRAYGRSPDFTGDDAFAPTVWQPEFSLGNLHNKALFLLGYYGEIACFCDAVLDDTPVAVGNLDDAEEGIRIYDAFKRGPDNWVEI